MADPNPAHKLVLEDGTKYPAETFGAFENVAGEVVFNTGMVGYPETLTDPSYKGQILTITYPLIGNYGIPESRIENEIEKYFESDKIQISGLIVSYYSEKYSHWNAKKSLGTWLKENNIPALCGIDTRALTQKLRDSGSMLGKIVVDKSGELPELSDPNQRNLAGEVSIKSVREYGNGDKKVVLVDCGTKNNILRTLLQKGIKVIRVPWDYDFNTIDADGILISNGPGDPKMCTKTIENTKKSFSQNKPILGICLGSQIIGLAAGANSYKLKYGHRGLNQPCVDVLTKKCYITSQNHGFALSKDSIPKDWILWFVNNNDQTVEGIKHATKPIFSVQFHPEASPGPNDSEFVFDTFLNAVHGI